MSRKNLVILGITIFVGIVLFLPEGGGDAADKSFPKMVGEINEIEITRGGVSSNLYLDDGVWRIRGGRNHKADVDLLEPILDFVKNDLKGELVSDLQVYDRYGLNENDGIKYAFFDGKNKLGEVVIGSRGNKRESFYLLWGSDAEVYQVQANRSTFAKSAADFIDKKVVARQANEVNALTIFKGGEELVLRKTESEEEGNRVVSWQDEGGNAYDLAKVRDLVNTIADLRANDFLDEREKSDFDGFAYRYVLNSTGGWSVQLNLYEEVGGSFIAGLEASPNVFTLTEEDSARLTIENFSDLR